MSLPKMRMASDAPGSPEPIVVGGDSNEGAVSTRSAAMTVTPDIQTGSFSSLDGGLRWVKELVAATIGASLTVCLLLMLWRAFDFLGRDQADPSFQRIKDLLLFINPLVGVVIGYYFNRVSTEARAEGAERTAQLATATAQEAQSARKEAEAQTETNKAQAKEANAALKSVIPAAQRVLSHLPPMPQPDALGGAVGPAVATVPLAEARIALERSLDHARAVIWRDDL